MNSSTHHVSHVNSEVHLLTLLLFFYGFTSINIPKGGGDLNFWSEWTIYIKQHGIRNVYDLYTRPAPGEPPSFLYGPVCMYLLYFLGKWQGSIELMQRNAYQFKVLILIFDMVGIWFALRYVRDKINRPFYALFLLFNIGLLYDTISWGQVDAAITCLSLMALYYALRGQLALSGITFVMALLIKPQPIIFLPVLGILWLTCSLKKPSKYTGLSLTGVVLAVLILVWPFIQAGTFGDYWSMQLDSAKVYPLVSVNAGNVWNLLLTDDPHEVSDQLIWLWLTYKQWGLLMFSSSYFIILFPLLQQFYQIMKGGRTNYNTSLVLLIFGLVPIIFYFFNTQMHERYADPCVLLLAAYALSTGDFIPYIVASIANFWVMDKYLKMFGLYDLYEYITLEHVAILFLFVLVWGVFKLYRKFPIAERELIVL